MRVFKFSIILLLFSMFLTMGSHETLAFWWKSKSEKETTEKVETQNSSDAKTSSRTGSFWHSSSSTNEKLQAESNSTEKPDPDRFLSREEREQKEFEREKAEKGIFFAFPWAKKSESQKTEISDPFGSVKEEAPRYQNLEELGISPSTAPAAQTVNLPTPGATANFDMSAPYSAVNPNGNSTVNSSVNPGLNSTVNSSANPGLNSTATHGANSALNSRLNSELHSGFNPAPENVAVGSAVEIPAALNEIPSSYETLPDELPSAMPNVGGQESGSSQKSGQTLESYQEETQAKLQSDTIFKRMPSLTADSSTLGGDGVQYYGHGMVLAQVGNQVILSGDLMANVDRIMEENKQKIPEEYWELQREMLTRALLEQSVESKLIYCDVLRNVPPEGIKQNFKLIDDLFEDSELPARMKKEGVMNREEYEKKLAAEGTCIQKQKYLYREAVFCQQWLMKTIPQSPTVSYIEIDDYYHANIKDFETPPKARWEELVIRKSRFHSREEAYQEITRIGSLVAVQKKPFDQVAKEFSHGVTAADGGAQDWITPGQLASEELEKAIFSQPVGQLSATIIEDKNCFYVIRVLDRREIVRKPLGDCQGEIHTILKKQKIEQAREEYFKKLRREIPVFTIFDGIPSPDERLRAEQEAAQQAMGQRKAAHF